jgi:hypothetical protein
MSAPRHGTRLALALLTVAVAGSTAVATNDVARGAVVSALADPLAVMAGRSPGTRSAGALTQTKAGVRPVETAEAVPPFVPTERVLSGGRVPEAPTTFVDVPAIGGPFEPAPPSDSFPGLVPAGPGGAFLPQPGSFVGFPPPIGGGGTVPPGDNGVVVPPVDGGTVVPPVDGGTVVPPGGDTSVNPPIPPATNPPIPPVTVTEPPLPPISPVPEPASWAMLIIGFMAIGASLRRRGRRIREATISAVDHA